jgi:hypothetical protein
VDNPSKSGMLQSIPVIPGSRRSASSTLVSGSGSSIIDSRTGDCVPVFFCHGSLYLGCLLVSSVGGVPGVAMIGSSGVSSRATCPDAVGGVVKASSGPVDLACELRAMRWKRDLRRRCNVPLALLTSSPGRRQSGSGSDLLEAREASFDRVESGVHGTIAVGVEEDGNMKVFVTILRVKIVGIDVEFLKR